MFENSKFSGNIDRWNILNVKEIKNVFDGSPLEGNEPVWYKYKIKNRI